MTSADIYPIVAEACTVVCFSCGFVIALLFFWLFLIHSHQKA